MNKNYLLSLLLILFLFSCKKEEAQETPKEKLSLKSYLVNNASLSKFVALPDNKTEQILYFNGNKRVFDRGKVISTHAINSKDGQVAFYIVNYEKPGFIILSADTRVPAILAFSEESNFKIREAYPLGLANWLNETKEGIEAVRKENKLKKSDDFDLMINSRMTLENDTRE